ncbi:CRTAC1 family protein [Halocatena marina]|uniref:CRTAC1 family protein n=1 Tax=Halocatena marina TaxID=2934937 RepID=UPI00200EFB6D|nr:CRTAC1 family protein [Halocatena marina]
MRREGAVVATVVLIGALMYLVPAAMIFGPELVDGSANASDINTPNTSQETRLAFTDVAKNRSLSYEAVRKLNGTQGTMGRSGVYVTDYNGDLRGDVLLVGGKRPMLFRNTGDKFVHSNALPALNDSAVYRSALFVDYNNDGREDLVLNPMHGEPILLHNNGDSFVPQPDAFDARIEVPVAVTAADYNGDGCTDIFVTQNGDWIHSRPARIQPNQTTDNGKPNFLFRGTCTSSFERVTDAGLDGAHWSLSASFVDFTGDGKPDVHVANDFHHDILYVNQGDGTFSSREIPNTNRNGMASEVDDVDGDGDMDIFVSNIYWTRDIRSRLDSLGVITSGSIGNNLLINDGDGNFTDQASEWEVRNGRWGWAAVLEDLDNDGDQDLFHTTRKQFVPEEVQDRWGDAFDRFAQSRIFERIGSMKFEARSAPDVGFEKTDGRGVGQYDFDVDGDADLLVANVNGQSRLYRNDAREGNALQLTVRPNNGKTVLGTKVTVITQSGTYHERVTAKADFLSQDSRMLHIGVGDVERAEVVRIEYPSGDTVTFRDYRVGQRLVIQGDRIVERRSFTPANMT